VQYSRQSGNLGFTRQIPLTLDRLGRQTQALSDLLASTQELIAERYAAQQKTAGALDALKAQSRAAKTVTGRM
jgi:hypothetical protein